MDHPKPWLKYVEADRVDDRTLDLDGMNVRNDAGDKLGEVDGFIVDEETGRTYYVVVNASTGWFLSKQFLLPIGQIRLDGDRDALVVGLTKDQVRRFPGFDNDEFDKLTEADIKRVNDDICRVVEPNAAYSADEPYYEAWKRPSYQYPDWWDSEPALPNRMGSTVYDKGVKYPPAGPMPTKRERSSREARSEVNDVSPHFDGRAQPGDVLGVETGGERTYIGDTKEDENVRREKAEEADRNNRK